MGAPFEPKDPPVTGGGENGRGGVTRRAFLGGTLTGVAGSALPRAVQSAAHPRRTPSSADRRVDVAVVGAGLAGLTAARVLARHAVSVVVLEARDRVGGRTLNHQLKGGRVIEVGGQWVGPLPGQPGNGGYPPYPQSHVFRLAKEVGVGTFKTYNRGDYLDYSNGRLIRYTGRIPPDPGAPNAGYAEMQLDQMSMSVPPEAPWTAPQAEDWDRQTFEDWMRQNLQPPNQPPGATQNALVNLGIEAVFAAEPRDLSLLHALFYIASAGSLENLVNTAGGAQDSRFIGGSQLISIRVARALGDKVVLRSPVRRIDQDDHGVTVRSDLLTVRAGRVIVAIPPHLSGHIVYEPSLATYDGGHRDQLTQRLPMGTVIKVHCLYPTPFWRSDGLAGQATSDTGPVKVTFDNSPHPDSRPGVLLGFIEGDDARVWSAKPWAARRKAVIDSMVRYFGQKAARPIGYVEHLWAKERWTGGCYGAFFPTGVWLSYGDALSKPIGRVHWAGTETATRWMGYMDGAVRSGERAAQEVMARLGARARVG